MSADLQLLSTAEVAALLSVRAQSVRKWRLTGRGPPFVKLGGPGGRVSYRKADLEAWIDARTFKSTAAETVARDAVARSGPRSP